MTMHRRHVLFVFLGLSLCALPFRARIWAAVESAVKNKSVADRVAEFGDPVRQRLSARFEEIGVAYPPKRMTLVGLKQERVLEVWVSDSKGDYRFLKSYPFLAASGRLGPKLAEGDCQVPEGLYQIESLNPNSLYHLSLRVNYPNSFDRQKAKADGRVRLGGDIMIHGKAASVGCLAMGDEAAEDLFVLAAKTKIENIELILSPVDYRITELPKDMPPVPAWTADLYDQIQRKLLKFSEPKGEKPALPL